MTNQIILRRSATKLCTFKKMMLVAEVTMYHIKAGKLPGNGYRSVGER